MIVTCPECAARYRLADNAIPPEGRAMRCASCKHRWFELPSEDDAAPEMPPAMQREFAPATVVVAPNDALPARRTELARRTEPAVAVAGPAAPVVVPTPLQTAWSPDPDEPEMPRGSPVLKTLVAIVLALVFAAGAAALWIPDLPPIDTRRVPWLDTLLHPAARPKSPLTLAVSVERQPLGDGRTVFALNGTIANPTASAQPVAGLEGRLIDAQGRVAYRWVILPPVTTLAPGGSARFDASAIGTGGEAVTVALR